MSSWKTKLKLGERHSDSILTSREIFQCDSLSPLWFCLAMNPLSKMLNATKYGFLIKSATRHSYKLNHLLFMDDLKLYASNRTHLSKLPQTTKQFSDDIKMSFGLDKCATLDVKNGKCANSMIPQQNLLIKNLPPEEMYKYLGFQQQLVIEHSKEKECLLERYFHRINMILKTELNSKNKFKAINGFCVPVLTYSIGIIKWSKTDIDNVSIKTRKLLTKHRMHHPKSAVERIYLPVPRKSGGRCLINLQKLRTEQILNLRIFSSRKNTLYIKQ